jgi:hypothetical protein
MRQSQARVDNSTFQSHWGRRQFQALTFGTVQFIPAPVPCRRIDTSVPTGSGGPFQARISSMEPFVPDQSQARVEDSTLQSKLDPGAVSGTNLQHGAVRS